ncbi:HIT domain-containing protein [Candidatus Micrarchaeota archaeon]|nr:HIT domain-containing protein [Candidatus Micrarchaeota archaeon]
MDNCIFCRIAKHDIPAEIVFEDKNYVAFLDIRPSMDGQTLVIPKKHFEKYVFDMKDAEYVALLKAARKVVKKIDKALKPRRTCLVIEGFDVPHVHVKLYPVQEGYLKLFPTFGPSAADLKRTADKIRGV